MKELLKILTDDEKKLLNKIIKECNDMADVEEQISNYLMLHCMADDDLTKEGIMCETILNKIGNLN